MAKTYGYNCNTFDPGIYGQYSYLTVSINAPDSEQAKQEGLLRRDKEHKESHT
jgi:hypothetical protein